MTHEVLTAAQAGVLLQKSARAVRDLLRAGRLPGAKVGKDWRISRAALDRFLAGEDRRGDLRDAAIAEIARRETAGEPGYPPGAAETARRAGERMRRCRTET